MRSLASLAPAFGGTCASRRLWSAGQLHSWNSAPAEPWREWLKPTPIHRSRHAASRTSAPARVCGHGCDPCPAERAVPLADTVSSVLESILRLRVNLPGIVVMNSTEREAVVREQVTVRHVQRAEGCREVWSEVLAKSQIEACVARQVARWRIAVGEARAIVEVG